MKILMIVGMIIFFVIFIGIIIEWINLRLDKKKYLPTGNFVDVNGNKMHIFIEGDIGKTIVLVPGLSTPSPYVKF